MRKSSSKRQHVELPGYEFLNVLGVGGFASVYRAINLQTNQYVAIKAVKSNVDRRRTQFESRVFQMV
jgi:cell division control protein CDC15